jgi:GNAT superfamily N-acetyltransferase
MQIRQAITADAQSIGEVHVRNWQVGLAEYMDPSYLEGITARDVTMQWLRSLASPIHADTLVAEDDDGRVVGLIDFGHNRNELGFEVAEVYGLYVDPDCWNRGIDAALLSAAQLHLAETGFRSAIVWTLTENDGRRRFYEDNGWRWDGVNEWHRAGAEVVRYSRDLR